MQETQENTPQRKAAGPASGTEEKEQALRETLRGLGRAAIAYSGGIDSHFLLTMALQVLGRENVLAVLCRGSMMPKAEAAQAEDLLKGLGARYRILDVDPLKIPQFASNDKKRCYYCKKYLMGLIGEYAREHGFDVLLDGKNSDDGKAYRPGAQAARELGIVSPLFECGFTKSDIRACARRQGVPIWDKPSQACLASRFPYDTRLTEEKLQRVAQAEAILHEAGFAQCRVRVHQEIARIEVEREARGRLLACNGIAPKLRALGFSFVTMDLEGFRSGSFDA